MSKRFTFIELLVVIGIMAILVTILLPSLGRARKTAVMAVCLSNISQINQANAAFLSGNNSRFIDHKDLIRMGRVRRVDANSGYYYAGGGGRDKNLKRPLNQFLGYDHTEEDEISLTVCPESSEKDKSSFRSRYGTSYLAAGRIEHGNDLDGGRSNNDSMFLQKINNPQKMVFMAPNGVWHASFLGVENSWVADNHKMNKKFPMSFIDGHGSIKPVLTGKGLIHGLDEYRLTNID